MDVDNLLKALNNDQNEYLIHLTTAKIKQMKIEILKELHLSQEDMLEILQKLREYKYVDELSDFRTGAFIRWIPITDPENIYLTGGGIVCDIKITDKGMMVTCKNFARKYYQLKPDECLIFQKLSQQEQVLLAALDHLSK